MTRDELEMIERALLAGKVAPEKVSTEYAFQRAWNEGVDWSRDQIKRLFKNQNGQAA